MRRVLLSIFILIPLFVFADVQNRGRLDYEHHQWEFVIPLLLLLIGGGFFLFYWAKDYWHKHKDDILGFLSLMIIVAGITGGIYILYNTFLKDVLTNNPNTKVAEVKPQQQKEEPQLPKGFRPVEPGETYEFHNSQSSDPWASYPPVITDGSQMTNKQNDFMVAAILNPTFSIYDLYVAVDMTPQNTQFLTFERYCRSKFIRERYTPSEFRQVYNKVSRAWDRFVSVQNTNFKSPEIIPYMIEYSQFDVMAPRIEDAENPQLIRMLKTKPLYTD